METLAKILFVLGATVCAVGLSLGVALPAWLWGVPALGAFLCLRAWRESRSALSHHFDDRGRPQKPRYHNR